MRIDDALPAASRVLEEDTDLAVLPDASGQSQAEAGPQPPPPVAEEGTLAAMARDTDRLARHFDREPSSRRMPERPVAVLDAAAADVLATFAPAADTPLADPAAAVAVATPAAAAAAAGAQPPAAEAPVVATAATATGAAASSYVGERPVDPQWLADRENALVAIRDDYTAARTAAQSAPGTGPGWTAAVIVADEGGTRSASGREIVFVGDPNAPPVIAGYDEGGAVYRPAGQWMEFDEQAFAAHYRAQGGAGLQTLASLYDTDVPGLFAAYPEIWSVATGEHAINAGPAPAGRAMGDAAQLGMLDLYLRDPQIAALIDAYGGSVAPATSDIAREQVRIYGQQRYDQLSRLSNALASVRDQYTDAMAQAQASGDGPGWIERARTVTVSEGGQQIMLPLYVSDENGQPLRDAAGQPQPLVDRVFDPDVFTAWYTQQGGLQHQALQSLYGQSHTSYASDESGRPIASGIGFDNANWSLIGVGARMAHNDLAGIDPNSPPRLYDRAAVGFDLEAGWATARGNIKPESDRFGTIVQVAIVAAASYFTGGAAATWASGAGLSAAAGAAVAGAAAGATASALSGAMNGNLSFKGIVQGALSGALTAGLLQGPLGAAASSYGPAGTIALRTTVQGGIQALMGGSFKDGAIAGLASGLADLASANMLAGIDKAVAEGTMAAAEAATARTLARVLGSAIRVAGNPDDPAAAFAGAFLSDVLNATDPAGFRNQQVQAQGGGGGAASETTSSGSQRVAGAVVAARQAPASDGVQELELADYGEGGSALGESIVAEMQSQPDPKYSLAGSGAKLGNGGRGVRLGTGDDGAGISVATSASGPGMSESDYWNNRAPTIADRYAETYGGAATLTRGTASADLNVPERFRAGQLSRMQRLLNEDVAQQSPPDGWQPDGSFRVAIVGVGSAGSEPAGSGLSFLKGAGYGALRVLAEPVLQVGDLLQVGNELGRSWITGEAPRDISYLSMVGQFAGQGASTEQIIGGGFASLMRTPDRIGDAYRRGDYYALGEEVGSLGVGVGLAAYGGRGALTDVRIGARLAAEDFGASSLGQRFAAGMDRVQYGLGTTSYVVPPGTNRTPNLATGIGYDAGDVPVRIPGEWGLNDLKQGLLGHPPRGLGSPDLHHGGQMPGAALHEVLGGDHRGNSALHLNRWNQGVSEGLRLSDRQLHWWYRAREQGADQLLPNWIYD